MFLCTYYKKRMTKSRLENNTLNDYKSRTSSSLDERKRKSKKLLDEYPDRVPVIVLKLSKFNPHANLQKSKFLCPKDLTVGQLLHVVRKFMEDLKSSQSLFLMLEATKFLPPTGDRLGDVYYNHRDEDGFLYFVVYTENVFGSFILS